MTIKNNPEVAQTSANVHLQKFRSILYFVGVVILTICYAYNKAAPVGEIDCSCNVTCYYVSPLLHRSSYVDGCNWTTQKARPCTHRRVDPALETSPVKLRMSNAWGTGELLDSIPHHAVGFADMQRERVATAATINLLCYLAHRLRRSNQATERNRNSSM